VSSHDVASRSAWVAEFIRQVNQRHLPIAGAKAFQKLLYFAQDRGWPTRFNFKMHFFGPYSEDADAVLELLQSDDVVMRDPQGGGFIPGAQSGSIALPTPLTTSARRAIAELVRNFQADDPNSLELLATIKYVWDSDRAVHGRATPGAVARKVSRYKPRFSDEQVREGIRRLKASRYIH
jgi:uncharacterized protein YwgA